MGLEPATGEGRRYAAIGGDVAGPPGARRLLLGARTRKISTSVTAAAVTRYMYWTHARSVSEPAERP